ncbi:penicillin-insensitive murein endopeptidase [Hartmannibacter diazotrophicus]|nr:penicillin-insensitive murein endopeptidase [Hartmannibacter diazotrophicus]
MRRTSLLPGAHGFDAILTAARKGLAAACLLLAAAVLSGVPSPAHADDTPAKQLFGARKDPAPLAPQAIGSYARGCLAGAAALPINGPGWQVMRLSRNRNWGHPSLVAYLERLASKMGKAGWQGLLIGDMSQPRGGPMISGHASHQIGLDADIWVQPMPGHLMSASEREKTSAISVLDKTGRAVDRRKFTPQLEAMIKTAAKDPAVARIFVNRAIKRAMCDDAGKDRSWLGKLRPWYGHDDHIHVRIDCPKGSPGCKEQAAPPPGDGCGKELDWWFTDGPFKKPDKPAKKPKPVTLKDLPPACATVLTAQ